MMGKNKNLWNKIYMKYIFFLALIIAVSLTFAYAKGQTGWWTDIESETSTTYKEYMIRHPVQKDFTCKKIHETNAIKSAKSYSVAPRVLLLVNSEIQTQIQVSITQYINDLEIEGYEVVLMSASGGTPADIKNLIKNYYNTGGLTGCVLIGDFPVPWFEHEDVYPYLGGRYEYPIDMYYMDLNGNWIDSDSDGMFDLQESGSGDIKPEIWLGRLTASPLGNETSLLQKYFHKNHKYRAGELVLDKIALAYTDDYYSASGPYCGDQLRLIYDNVQSIYDNSVTTAAYYKQLLAQPYHFVTVYAHSNATLHAFQNGSENEYVTYNDIISIKPRNFFYNLKGCHTANYIEKNYLAGWYIFCDGYGLVAVGPATKGSMINEKFYYKPLGEGKTFGESYKEWLIENINISSYIYPRDIYPVVMCGDPTLRIEYENVINVSVNLENASFTITGPQIFASSGKMWSIKNVPPGNYTITYNNINGYIAPQAETKTLNNEGTITFTGVYNLRGEIVNVWPGDLDNDGVVDVYDVMAIGEYYAKLGHPRANASSSWSGQPCAKWNLPAETYADADGNGIIDENEILIIDKNYGMVH